MIQDEEVDEVIEALQNHYAEHLTEWEAKFLASVAEQWEEQGELTPKQQDKLEQVFDRVSRSGRFGGRSA